MLQARRQAIKLVALRVSAERRDIEAHIAIENLGLVDEPGPRDSGGPSPAVEREERNSGLRGYNPPNNKLRGNCRQSPGALSGQADPFPVLDAGADTAGVGGVLSRE
jgi:hypothetical protein